MHIFRHIFLSNYWWQRSDIWSQASYRYPISWEAFLDPSDSYFLFADLVGSKNATHNMVYLYDACDQISDFCHQQLLRKRRWKKSWKDGQTDNYWWQKSDIWSQASYRYVILWELFLDPSDSYFLFPDLVGLYTHWTYKHIFRHIFLSNYWWQRSDNIRFLPSTVTEKKAMKKILEGRTDGQR
jgi:hypothetical protein